MTPKFIDWNYSKEEFYQTISRREFCCCDTCINIHFIYSPLPPSHIYGPGPLTPFPPRFIDVMVVASFTFAAGTLLSFVMANAVVAARGLLLTYVCKKKCQHCCHHDDDVNNNHGGVNFGSSRRSKARHRIHEDDFLISSS